MQNNDNFIWKDIFTRKHKNQPLLDKLKSNILFQDLSKQELRYLSAHVYERNYQANEVIFNKNDRGLGLYLISKGRIGIQSGTENAEVSNLDQNTITILEEGSFFGELALIDQHNIRTATAVALEQSILIGFFKPDLEDIADRNPAMGVKIFFRLACVLGERLKITSERLALITRTKSANLNFREEI